MKYLGLFSIVIYSQLLFSQEASTAKDKEIEKNYLKFRNFFEQELSSHKANKISDTINFTFPTPEYLPGWFCNTAATNPDSMVVFGISDPGMDAETGLMLAKHRALLLLALFNNTNVANMRDNFSNNKEDKSSVSYIEYTEFTSHINLQPDDLVILETHTTQYDETVILARVSQANIFKEHQNTPHFNFHASLYTHTRKSGSKMQMDEKLDLETNLISDNKPNRFLYQYAKINGVVNTSTRFNNELVSEHPALKLRYIINTQEFLRPEKSGIKDNTGQSLQNGLWHALISSVLMMLADKTHDGSIHFKQVADVYNNTSFFLSREFVGAHITTSMPLIQIHDNCLYLIFSNIQKND